MVHAALGVVRGRLGEGGVHRRPALADELVRDAVSSGGPPASAVVRAGERVPGQGGERRLDLEEREVEGCGDGSRLGGGAGDLEDGKGVAAGSAQVTRGAWVRRRQLVAGAQQAVQRGAGDDVAAVLLAGDALPFPVGEDGGDEARAASGPGVEDARGVLAEVEDAVRAVEELSQVALRE